MKKIITISALMLVASFGFAQRNITLHQNTGSDYVVPTMAVDSITFSDFVAPGTDVWSTYNEADSIGMEHHSKVTWTAGYKGDVGIIGGGFDYDHAEVAWDETDPANIHFEGMVQLSTANTFEPGRDGPGHCVNSSLGVTWYTHIDSITEPGTYTTVYDSTEEVNDWAYFEVTAGSVSVYGDGYMALGTFTYKGDSGELPIYFQYKAESTGAPYKVIEAQWQFDAGVESTDQWYCGGNIKSTVYVQCHMKFHHL